MVKFAENLGMILDERTQEKMKITDAANISEEYNILANFPFSSETKRMGILVRHIETGRLIFYLKGADIIMQNKVKN